LRSWNYFHIIQTDSPARRLPDNAKIAGFEGKTHPFSSFPLCGQKVPDGHVSGDAPVPGTLQILLSGLMGLRVLHRTLCRVLLLIAYTILCSYSESAVADDGSQLWLKYKEIDDKGLLKQYRELISSLVVTGEPETCSAVRNELNKGLRGLLGREIPTAASIGENSLVVGTPRNSVLVRRLFHAPLVERLSREGFFIKSTEIDGKKCVVIAANEDIGLLHGAFRPLQLIQTHQSLENLDIVSKPKIQYRLLDPWDNLDGTIERGYAGKSLWKWNDFPDRIDERYRDYARANASIGINGTVLNNVNAHPIILETEYLAKVAALADIFRPYGIRVFLSVNFASPISGKFESKDNQKGGIGNLETADPLDPEVRLWWKNKVKKII